MSKAIAQFSGKRAQALFAGMATHSVLSLEACPAAAVSLTLMAAGHASGWPILRGGAFLQEIQYLTSQSEHQGTRLPRTTGHESRSSALMPRPQSRHPRSHVSAIFLIFCAEHFSQRGLFIHPQE